jgi:hypothetical protein
LVRVNTTCGSPFAARLAVKVSRVLCAQKNCVWVERGNYEAIYSNMPQGDEDERGEPRRAGDLSCDEREPEDQQDQRGDEGHVGEVTLGGLQQNGCRR